MKKEHRTIIDICVDKSGIPEEFILSKSRKRVRYIPRAVVCKIMYEETASTLKEVGRSMAWKDKPRDYTTILRIVRNATKLIKEDKHGAKQLYEDIMATLKLEGNKNKLIVYYPDNYNVHRIITHINKLGNKEIKYQLT
jgi:chromosomal replication initiation ATPase DnaA